MLLYLVLLLLSTLVSAEPKPTEPTVYNNCSGHLSAPPADNIASTAYYKPQIRINPLDANKNGTAWEEWLFVGHNRLPDGTELMYGYKFALGDPTSANVSHTTLITWAYFPNGTFYRGIGRGRFEWEEYGDDGGFRYSIGNNHLSWDAKKGVWNTTINVGGYIIEGITVNVEPGIPYGPNYKSKQGQISEGFFSRLDAPRALTKGVIVFPWGLKYTLDGLGTLKHSWSDEIMANAISAYVRGSTFLPDATVSWYQAWDNSGKEVQSVQYLGQADSVDKGQVFRVQVTGAPDMLNIETTPKPVGLPLAYNGTEITLPMCGPGADPKKGKMSWKVHNIFTLFDFVDFAGGHTLTQRVNVTGHVWVDGAAVEVAGGLGIVEVYHRFVVK